MIAQKQPSTMVEDSCIIKIPTCKNDSEYSDESNDFEDDEDDASTNLMVCLSRAKYWYEDCENDSSAPVTATFSRNNRSYKYPNSLSPVEDVKRQEKQEAVESKMLVHMNWLLIRILLFSNDIFYPLNILLSLFYVLIR